MTKNDEMYAEHGFDRFFMVAAMQKPGDPPLTDEQQKEFQPLRKGRMNQQDRMLARYLEAKE